MERRTFGKTGLEVSVLGFGGAEIGFENASDADVEKLLNAALDAGLNVIDTAECYADSEEKIGRAVSGRRNDFYLFTKCGHSSGLEGADWDPKMLAQSIDRSLQRLQTDTVDLIDLHTCDVDTLRKGDVIEVLRRAKEAGKTRYIGYSGDNEGLAYAVESGAFDAIQTSINVADQANLSTIELAAEKGLGTIAKRPIANAAWVKEPAADAYGRPYWERLQELQYPGLDVAMALRWTLAQPVHTAIVGTKNPERWGQNAALLEGEPLPIEAVEAIVKRWKEVAPKDWVALS
ncbi:aldo/keto reductase [bacterium]|nr:MAG: aldo/keto reductase [bacterium]